MSDTVDYSKLFEELGFGGEPEGEKAKPAPIEFVDPTNGQKRTFESQEKLQEYVNQLNANYVQQLQQIAQQRQQPQQTPETKPSVELGDLSEAEMREFSALSQSAPLKAWDYLLTKSPSYSKLQQQLEETQRQNAQLQQAMTTASFMSARKSELIDNPNAAQVQQAVAQVLQAQGITQPNAVSMNTALAYVKEMRPDLFPQAQTQAQGSSDNPFAAQNRVQPPPVPGRTGSENYGQPNLTEMIGKIYTEKGADAAGEAIRRAIAASGGVL